jgi:tetratricopeptide (TPR) repeat protein
MKSKLSISFIAALIAISFASASKAADTVKIWEEWTVVPTYLIGPPDPNPQFYFGGGSQGAQHRIYPYPAYDNLTTKKLDKSYKMVYLENQYIRVAVVPELGGKIFEAIDKTNGYNFFYRQHVIKPALISLLGAWISGGVEWDVPHHHRATSFLPVQSTTEESPDGSKTVWVGELELRDRMRWAVGITLHPGKSYLQASFRMINRTPVPTSMLCFSNVAVSVNDTYQVIFPPSTQHVTYHAKRDFTTWPIATTYFNGADFTAGVDVSWYKNHYNSMSMFAWNYTDDFLAGYDHGKNAGTMSIADHNVVPGKKFWTWGNGPNGRAQDTLLTDSDGPYIELMVGAYSDNQPDYSWMEPYESRAWSQYWYPFRDIDGAKNANTDAAVNLEVKAGKVHVGFYATADHPSATVSVKLKDQTLLTEQIAINPASSYTKEIALPAGADEHDIRASLSADGKELVAYSPVRLQPEAMPAPVTSPLPPEQIKTNEELYLTGLRIEQFHAPAATPDPYWEEALKRDPGDVRVNTALGIDALKAGRFADAEKLLRKALERATDKYTSPKDGEPFYYLGLALKAQGKMDDASAQFAKSTWSAAWKSAGYLAKAQIDCMRGDFEMAASDAAISVTANTFNVRALALQSAALRHTQHPKEALQSALIARRIEPLDVIAIVEYWMAGGNSNVAEILKRTFNEHPSTLLETAVDYMDAGLWQDAANILTLGVTAAPDKSKISPLVYYDLAYVSEKLNQPDKAAEYDQLAVKSPTDLVFPFQMEMIDVLEHAMAANPSDSRAPYYLGNLLYDWQPQKAIALWEKSASLGADFPVVYRNLALVYTRQPEGRGQAARDQSSRDPAAREQALANLEKAAKYGGSAMVFEELDKLYEENGVTPEKRLALLAEHQPIVNRDDIISRQINLEIFAGKYDDAITLMKSRFFRAWEGGQRYSLGDSWINANLLRGRQHLGTKEFKDALADFQSAAQMPANLQDATGNVGARNGEIAYWTGVAYDALGDAAKAKDAWTQAAGTIASAGGNSPPTTVPTGRGRGRGRGGAGGFGRGAMGGLASGVRVAQAADYYQALALQKLGDKDRANAIFQQLIDDGARAENGAGAADEAANSVIAADQRQRIADAHYIAGLGQLGLNNKAKAKAEFDSALSASPDHLAAREMESDSALQ